jgi:hypothetical protein
MGAKQKLNEAFVMGGILMAAAMGWITGSWMVFIVVLVIIIGLNVCTGDIRA